MQPENEDYIAYSNNLLTLRQHATLEEVSLQLNTYKKFVHDYAVKMFTDVYDLKYVEWSKDEKLQPDLLFLNQDSELFVVEITFSVQDQILLEKEVKYKDISENIILLSPIKKIFREIDLTLIEGKFDLLTLDYFKRLKNFQTLLLENDLEISDINLYDEFYQFRQNLKDIDWSKIPQYEDNYKYEIEISSKNSKLFLKNLEKLMNDIEVQQEIDLEYTDKVNFNKIMINLVNTISHKEKFEQVDDVKLTFMFYPGEFDFKKDFIAHEYFPDHKEQQSIYEFMKVSVNNFNDFPLKNLFLETTLEIENNNISRTMFSTGLFEEALTEHKLRYEYQQNENYKKISFYKYMEDRYKIERNKVLKGTHDKFMKDDIVKIQRRKTTTYNASKDNEIDISFLLKSKTNMSNEEYIKGKVKKMNEILKGQKRKTSIRSLERNFEEFEKWKSNLDNYTKEENIELNNISYFLLYETGDDIPFFKKLKNTHRENFLEFLKHLNNSKMMFVNNNTRMLQEQLMHYQELNLKDNNYTFFNSGIKDILYIVRHSSFDKGKDVGKAFCIMKLGKLTKIEQELYGFNKKYKAINKNVDKTLYLSSWRRLPSERIIFHIDQFYSVLSTTYNTYIRKKKTKTHILETNDIPLKNAMKDYIVRSLIGLHHTQQFAEMLADFRYLYLHSVSDFSSVEKFVMDKLCKPINNFMEYFLIKRIKMFQDMRNDFKSGGVKFTPSYFMGNIRDEKSTGGEINFPSILSNKRIRNIQDFLDEMFLYVHTNKEPSSQYHEFVKAFKTIVKYQEEFEKLSLKQKRGDILSYQDLKEMVLNPLGIGHCRTATQTGARLLSLELQNLNMVNKINNFIKQKNFLNINSTKACIPELPRETLTEDQLRERKKTIKQMKTNIGYEGLFSDKKRKKLNQVLDPCLLTNKQKMLRNALLEKDSTIVFPKKTKRITKTEDKIDKLVNLTGTNRCKVHDSSIHTIIKRSHINTVFDMASWNINKNKSRILADVCIKAQFGSKREFYVLNHGAKAMVKIIEMMFETISRHVQEEMISIPGDKKMFNIQNLVDKNTKLFSMKENMKTFFCNGDCTKWSAAETMECFDSFVEGFDETVLSKEHKNYCKFVLDKWKKKEIEIPKPMQKNIFFEKK